MTQRILFLLTPVLAVLLHGSVALGQEQADAITRIDGQTLTTDVARVYFNAGHCANAETILFDLTLFNADGVRNAFLWAGIENAGCDEEENRTDQTLRCRPLGGNPRTVNDNFTIFDITLQELIDTGVVDCENTALEGQPFTIYAFRNEDPGANNVDVADYGVAPFRVDVTPPDQLSLTNQPVQEGSSFTVAWSSPSDSQRIPEYRLYAASTDDPDAALAGGVVAQTGIDQVMLTATATDLQLAPGEEVYLFASAVDEAAVTIGDGNEGPLSESTLGIAAATAGFCDDPNVDCSGCSASSLVLPNGQPGSGIWLLLGLALALGLARRLAR